MLSTLITKLGFRAYLCLTVGTLLIFLSGATLTTKSRASLELRTTLYTGPMAHAFEFLATLITEVPGRGIRRSAFRTFVFHTFITMAGSWSHRIGK